jgi:UDP-glucose 4-epimerase
VRTLVTGAAGFIGSNLVDRLLADGHHVVGIDDLSTGSLENLAAARAVGDHRFSFITADVTAPALALLVSAAAPEVVFHLAAQVDVRVSVRDPLLDARLNVLGTVNVLEAARSAGVRKVVFTSSGGSIYGNPEKLPVSERAGTDPISPYAASKVCGEVYLGTYRNLYGLQTTALALGNVYGPRQDPRGEAGVIAIFCTAALEGRTAMIYGDGAAVRDYVYVDDVVDAFARAAGEAGDGRRFNIGTGVGTSVRELHTEVARAAQVADAPTFADARLGELKAIVLDVSSARHGLGWEPFTTLRDGVPRTLAWARSVLPAGGAGSLNRPVGG